MNPDDLLAACERIHKWTESYGAMPSGWLTDMRAVVSALPALVARVRELEQQLGNLRAVIHRDGGHYQTEHGAEKAIADAHAVVSGLVARVRELDSLDQRIKIAFSEMEIADVKRRNGDLPFDVHEELWIRFIRDGERIESLLGEMQSLTKEMKGGGDAHD